MVHGWIRQNLRLSHEISNLIFHLKFHKLNRMTCFVYKTNINFMSRIRKKNNLFYDISMSECKTLQYLQCSSNCSQALSHRYVITIDACQYHNEISIYTHVHIVYADCGLEIRILLGRYSVAVGETIGRIAHVRMAS